jgi:hypothetical protein
VREFAMVSPEGLLALHLPTASPSDILGFLARVEAKSARDEALICFFVESLVDIASQDRYSLRLADVLETVARAPALQALCREFDFSSVSRSKLEGVAGDALARVEALRRAPPAEAASDAGKQRHPRGRARKPA